MSIDSKKVTLLDSNFNKNDTSAERKKFIEIFTKQAKQWLWTIYFRISKTISKYRWIFWKFQKWKSKYYTFFWWRIKYW